jgi:hypothetical protein
MKRPFLPRKGEGLCCETRAKPGPPHQKGDGTRAPPKGEREKKEDRILRITWRSYKGLWWMPWCQMPKKDVGHCEKPRGAVNRHRSGDIRMGKPAGANLQHPMLNT